MTPHIIDRTRPPVTAALPAFHLPPAFEFEMPNGLQVVLVEDKRFPLVTARLGFAAGSKFDPADLAGLSETSAALLTEGTETRASKQIAEEIASAGGALSASSSADVLAIAGNALAENLEKLLDLLTDVACNASFPEDEVELRKQNRIQELHAQRSQASFLADEKMNAIVFGSHPYSRQDPTLDSIERMDRTALVGFRDVHLLPGRAVLVLLGALPPRQQVVDMVRQRFERWGSRSTVDAPPAVFPSPHRTVSLINRPGSVQADIRICHLAVSRANPDYFALLAANTVLGGGASSRLFTNIREKQGFAYDAGSSIRPMKDGGLFSVVTQVRNEVIEAALDASLNELTAIGSEPVTGEELATARNYLSGVFVMRLETQDGLASQLAGTKMLDLPLSYLETYTQRIRAVEPEEIRAAAHKYMHPEAASIVVVGDAAAIEQQLGKFGAVTVEQAER